MLLRVAIVALLLFVPVVPDLAAFVSSREDLAAARSAWAADSGGGHTCAVVEQQQLRVLGDRVSRTGAGLERVAAGRVPRW
ncbi:hypothetical protein ABZX92_27130 [Lentzea sp. NPDC006480]|uniref:hypothetical protein n=1 Tax=Lentzea sp. NPDC006480 TaxID=3157176 RepID=UPI0033BADACB